MRRVLIIALLAALSLLTPLVANVASAATLPPNHAQFVARVVELVNVERQRVGVPPLVANPALTRAAQDYAGVMGDGTCFAHNCDGTLGSRIDRAGYKDWTALAENIALGHTTPEIVMAAWMNSSGHRTNILNGTYKEIGVGLAVRGGTQLVWVQNFGASRNPVAEPPANCSTRPTFAVSNRRTAPGVLEITVTAGTNADVPSNTLRSIRVGAIANATVDVNGYGRVNANTTVNIAAGTRQVTLVVRRAAGGAAVTVPLTLTDACGDWPTFVGAGPNAL
jgi:uncharacterized protein YkwD